MEANATAKLQKKMEAEEMVSFFSQLPVEITTDIFSRLPVGSVIRCKLVCKAWRSFVQDPVFLDMHTSRLLLLKPAAAVAVTTTNTEFYLSVLPHHENRRKYYFGEYNINHGDEMSNSSSSSSSSCFKLSKPLNDANKDIDPFISKQYDWYPIGSSNGLICSHTMDRKTIYVYNPCTRECVRLPPLIPISISKQFNLLLFNGFGYNPLTNEYKVVLISSIRQEGIRQPGAQVCVYTLGSGKWRTNKLESFRHLDRPFPEPGVFFNGALHWIAWELTNIDHYNIFSFDLANEEFRMIVPSPPLSTAFNHLSFVELDGFWGGWCLCVRHWNRVTKTTDIWVLMMNSKDRDMKPWTMKFKIPAPTITDEENKLWYNYHPIALLGRNKILLYCQKRNESVFVSYNSETGNFEDEIIDYSELQPSKSKWNFCWVTPYTKSFISLKTFGEEDADLPF